MGPYDIRRTSSYRGSPRLRVIVGIFLFVLLASWGWAEYAVVYRTNGDRYTGVWRGGNDREYTIELPGGQRLRIPIRETRAILFADKVEDLPSARAQEEFVRGQQFLELGMKEEAETAFRRAIQESPRFADAHFALAELLEARNQVEEAMRYYGYAAQIAPKRFPFAERFKKVAERYLEQGEFVKAAEIFLTIAQRSPEDPAAEEAAYRAGFLFTERYQTLRQKQQGAPLEQPSAEAQQTLQSFLEKGLQAFQLAVSHFPEHADAERAQYLIGWLAVEKGDYSFAHQQLTQFIEAHPTSSWLAQAYLARGRASLALRQNQAALEDFEQALRLTTDRTIAAEARRLRNECAWQVYHVADGLPSNLVQALAMDGDILWVGTPKGLAKFDTAQGGWQKLPVEIHVPSDINVYALAADETNVWVGTLNNGLYRYNKALQQTEQLLPDEEVYAIELSGEEVWIGTFNGLRYYNTRTGEWLHFQEGLPALDVRAIAVTPETVWIGTSQNGLGVLDKATKTWTILNRDNGLPPPIGNAIRSLAAGPNRVWFTWYTQKANGYGWYDPAQNKVWGEGILIGTLDPLEGICVGVAEQQVWIAHYTAVFIHDLISSNWTTLEKPTTLGEITVLTVGPKAAWIGTTNGLGKIDAIIAARTAEL